MRVLAISMIMTVLLNLTSCALKYDIMNNDTIKNKVEDVYFNGIKLKPSIYVSPKIYVVGVVLNEPVEDADMRPIQTETLFIDKSINIQIPDFFTNYKGPKSSQYMDLPVFEVEPGREPLEYLIDTMKKKFGLDCWSSHRVGISNQYGYGYIDPAQVTGDYGYFGSSLHHMDPVLDDHTPMDGSLLGTFFGMVDSKPDFDAFQTPASSEVRNQWMALASKNKPVPAIFIGYTIGTDFKKVDPTIVAKKGVYKVSFAKLSESIGTQPASYNSTPAQAFVRMALMLDNDADGLITHGQNMMDAMLSEKYKAKDEEQKNVTIVRAKNFRMI